MAIDWIPWVMLLDLIAVNSAIASIPASFMILSALASSSFLCIKVGPLMRHGTHHQLSWALYSCLYELLESIMLSSSSLFPFIAGLNIQYYPLLLTSDFNLYFCWFVSLLAMQG